MVHYINTFILVVWINHDTLDIWKVSPTTSTDAKPNIKSLHQLFNIIVQYL